MIHKRHSIFLWIPAAAFTGAIVLLLLHIPSGQPSQHPPREPTVAAPQAAVAFPSNRVLAVFLDEPSEPILWSGKNPAARRARPIQPAPHWLAPGFKPNSGDWIELPLFSNAVFRAQIRSVTGHPGGTTGLTAHTPDGQTTIFLTFSDGQIRASVETAGGPDYSVRYDPDTGSHTAIEIDRENSILLECGCTRRPPDGDRPAEQTDAAPLQRPLAESDAPGGSTIVDVMILYTPAARAEEGGLAGINNNIAQAMLRANEAHTNSDTQVYLNLVHSAEVSYTEAGSANTDLDRLTDTDDGYMDSAHTLRDAYGADLVCLFVDRDDVGGLAWLLTSESGRPDYAFCLARVQQSDWTYTVVHEWGHNMGCSHSKSQTVQPWENGDFRSYSAGWQWSDSASDYDGFCSVMTYEDIDNDGADEYERVAHFSNPDIAYTGDSPHPTGHAANGDNARTIREMKAEYAAYRDRPLPPPNTDPVTNFPYAESFEYGYGHWSYDEGTIIWSNHTGATYTSDTGPDSAADGTRYVYIHSRNASWIQSKTGLLRATFDFREATSPEISFLYHLYGAGIGTLSLEASTDGSAWSGLWTRSGALGNQWNTNTVSLSAYAGRTNVQLRFRGTTRANINFRTGDMALDLITVRENSSPDSDGDGLPDTWEILYFGDPANADPADPAANGIDTLLESYIAGLDPTDPQAVLQLNIARPAGGETILQWTPTTGRLYSVQGAADPSTGFLPLRTNLTAPQSSWTDAVEQTRRFYRLDVRIAD